jgi:hypothetical protein
MALLIIAVVAIAVVMMPARPTVEIGCNTFVGGRVEGFANVRAGNNLYRVHEDLDNPQAAANLMDRLNSVALDMIQHLSNKYGTDAGLLQIAPPYRDRVRSSIAALQKNYRPSNLEENIPERSGGDTSYVIDKGDTFAMCLRDPKNGNHIDDRLNNLIFVLLHEMTHLFTDTFGHDKLFWNNFKFMLQEATEARLYSPINYKRDGAPYCGIVITYSPLYDPSMLEYHLK